MIAYVHVYSKLPKDLQRVVDEYVCPNTDYYREKIIEKLKIHPDLGDDGFKTTKSTYVNQKSFLCKNSITNIIECMNKIPLCYKKLKNKYKICSYGGKHVMEQELKNYVSNGEFIMSMLLLNWEYKLLSDSLDCIYIGRKLTEREKKTSKVFEFIL